MFKRNYIVGFSALLLLNGCFSYGVKKQDNLVPDIEYPQVHNTYSMGSIYHASSSRNIFEDIRANQIGDTITVILQEQTAASKSASTNTSKSSTLSVPSPTILGRNVTDNGVDIGTSNYDSSNEFAGAGDSSQSNSLTGSITVTVVNVLPNGNLVVQGRKSLTLNQGSEDITVSGIIRAIDITPENTINSGQIANARITYGGKGMLADSNKAGWLTRFFNSGWWPF